MYIAYSSLVSLYKYISHTLMFMSLSCLITEVFGFFMCTLHLVQLSVLYGRLDTIAALLFHNLS